MSKAKIITLDSTKDKQTHYFVITVDGQANSVWDSCEDAQEELKALIDMGNRHVFLSAIKPNEMHRQNTPAARARQEQFIVEYSPGFALGPGFSIR